MPPMRQNHSRSTRFATRVPAALIGLARLLARQAARDVIGSEKRLDRGVQLEKALETRPALPDQPMGSPR
jgi:hypothetical protein